MSKRKVLEAGLAILFLVPGTSQAIYIWRDAQGVRHYSEMCPAGVKCRELSSRKFRSTGAASTTSADVTSTSSSTTSTTSSDTTSTPSSATTASSNSTTSGGTGGANAGGRIFYDGFESGTTSMWKQDDYRNRCQVVTSAADGVVGPRTGSRMLRCNWNGTVAWNDPAAFETLTIPTDNYSNELFIRVWVRRDANLERTEGSPAKLIRLFRQEPYLDSFENIVPWNGLSHRGTFSSTYWGGAPGDNSNSHSAWHKVEYYFHQSNGTHKVWHDGILVRNDTGLKFGAKWSPLYITSNWSDPHDANNYVYFDDVEVFSDMATGATGSMSDATISR